MTWRRTRIPIFHADQLGTAIVTQAALNNALKIVDKDIEHARIVVSGVGATGNDIIRLLKASGALYIMAAGRDGILEQNTVHRDEHRQWLADNINIEEFSSSLKESIEHAAVVATGRSDFQFNNALTSLSLFRGLLDPGATDTTEAMLVAAADAIADTIACEETQSELYHPVCVRQSSITSSCRSCSKGRKPVKVANRAPQPHDDISF